jgi:hypothetical protein
MGGRGSAAKVSVSGTSRRQLKWRDFCGAMAVLPGLTGITQEIDRTERLLDFGTISETNVIRGEERTV